MKLTIRPFMTLIAGLAVITVVFLMQPGSQRTVISGVGDVPSSWVVYEDPSGDFALSYPSNWVKTESMNEVQWWDSLNGDGEVKVVLFETSKDTFDNVDDVFFEVDRLIVNTLDAITQRNDASETYYYRIDDRIIGLTAWFNDASPETRDTVNMIQNSLRPLP